MGLFSKSILILAIAISTPLIYRQFATDNTIKFMSQYYSNYKQIDRYLRQGASHIDQAKEYLSNSQQIQQAYEKVNKQVKKLIEPLIRGGQKDSTSVNKDGIEQKNYRVTTCPLDRPEDQGARLWSKEELAQFDGKSGSKDVLLGFLGVVYNVTLNAHHYGPGADYNAFAGKDATRAFVTGNFTHDLHDDIRDIDENMYNHFETWASFYAHSYQQVGRIEGNFYDSRGCATPELHRVYEVFDKLAKEKASQQEEAKQMPECNTEWNGDLKKGKVWCSTKSGGIERNWAGVPRIYDDGDNKRCVCLNLEAPDAVQQARKLVLYPGCDASASECSLQE